MRKNKKIKSIQGTGSGLGTGAIIAISIDISYGIYYTVSSD